MGWYLPGTVFTGAVSLSAPNILVSPIVVTLPSGVKDGDDVWVMLVSTTAILTSPAGYARLGAENHWTLQINTCNFFSIWRHTWRLGDPTTVTFTNTTGGAGYQAFIVRTNGTESVTTDTTTTGNSAAPPIGPFSPTTTAADLRLFVLLLSPSQGSVSFGGPPVAQKTDANPTGLAMQLLGGATWGVSTATAYSAWTYYGLWSDPTPGLDAVSANGLLGVTTNWLTRSIDLTDGTSLNGPANGDLADIGSVDPGITVDALIGSTSDAITAGKGRYVGGARLL